MYTLALARFGAQTRATDSSWCYLRQIPVLNGPAQLQNPLYVRTINYTCSGHVPVKHVSAVPCDTPLPTSRVRPGIRGSVRKRKLDALSWMP
jgi:hypothetical protein